MAKKESWAESDQAIWISRAAYLNEKGYCPGWSVEKIAEKLHRADQDSENDNEKDADPYSLAWKLDNNDDDDGSWIT